MYEHGSTLLTDYALWDFARIFCLFLGMVHTEDGRRFEIRTKLPDIEGVRYA